METTEAYLLASSELFLKYGIKSVTMDDISKSLGISKKTLYLHFKDKKDLVMQIMNYIMSDRANCHSEVLKTNVNAIEKFLLVAKTIINHLKANSSSAQYDLKKYYPDIYKEFSKRKSELIERQTITILQQGTKEDLFRGDINIEIMAKFQVGVINHIFEPNNNVFDTKPWSINIYKELMTHYLYGICNEKGVKVLKKLMTDFKTI